MGNGITISHRKQLWTMITPSEQINLTKGNKSGSSPAGGGRSETSGSPSSGPWLSLTAAAFFFFFFFFFTALPLPITSSILRIILPLCFLIHMCGRLAPTQMESDGGFVVRELDTRQAPRQGAYERAPSQLLAQPRETAHDLIIETGTVDEDHVSTRDPVQPSSQVCGVSVHEFDACVFVHCANSAICLQFDCLHVPFLGSQG
eukprot:FR735954.1.p1 GENE.FR735954.1~~FR735954.1.p1  ORF type:complete len:203 (-),score=23.72 FR735954.1:193-801(-)